MAAACCAVWRVVPAGMLTLMYTGEELPDPESGDTVSGVAPA
jgi:hypothetical protein